jgi:peptidoglycan/LPS O-acetylase OafA/YrhL
MNYRREVDGLRSVAVLPVILFHAGFTWMSGGFVGVDVFFVISGYLITTIILNELETGQFSITGFYERRARRILPALFLVLTCCVPLAYWLLLPDQLGGFSRSLASVMVFLSNVYFRKEVDYFARASEEEPLLHTWSLAVEEQYYVVFPLLAMLLWKAGRQIFLVTTITVALASFLYADSQSLLRPDKAFFDTRGRVWELLVGSLVAIYLLRWRKAPPRKAAAEIGGTLGLALIAWACLQFEQSTPFPGRYALAPTVGAALVILFANPETYAGRLLGSRVAVGIGLISYSAYLWHQPIFAFARVASPTLPASLIFAALSLLTLGLAYLSWRFVEQPFRNRQRFGRRQIFAFSIAGIFVFIAIAVLGHLFKGVPGRFGPDDSDLIVTYESRGNYVRARHQIYREAGSFDPQGGFKLLIVGDSFSRDLVNIIHEGQLFQSAQIRVHYIPVRCQVYKGDDPITELVEPSSAALCSRDHYKGLDTLVSEADAVLVAASWREWSAERLPVTLERLGIADKENYIIFGRKSLGYINLAAYVGWAVDEKAKYLNPVNDSSSKINKMLANTFGASHFVDIQALLCGDGSAEQCPIFDERGALLSHDGAHLTEAGARYLGHRLAMVPTVSQLSATAAQ